MSRLETSPNPLTKTADQWGGRLLNLIDGTKTPEQRAIKLPNPSNEDMACMVYLSGIVSMLAGTVVGLCRK